MRHTHTDMPDMAYMSYTGRHSRDADRSEMQIGRDAYRQRCREAEMQRGRDAERQGCRDAELQRGRYADGAEMQMGQICRGAEMHRGREADMQIYREIHLGERDRETWGEREGGRETIPAICTDRYTGNCTIIDTDQRQSH